MTQPSVMAAPPGDGALVCIRPGGPKPPLYCVHAQSGHLRLYAGLARHLDPGWPVYGLRAVPRDDAAGEPYRRLEEMAARYAREILAFQPHGPYYILGECDGGELAFELAQQLRERGNNVRLLALVDSFGPGGPPIRASIPRPAYRLVDRARMVGFHVRTAARLPRAERSDYVRTRVIRLSRRVRAKLLRDCGAQREAHRQEAFQAALGDYTPRPYAGRMVLFRGAKLPWGIESAGELGWADVAPALETVVLPAYFGTNMLEPHIGRLAEELESAVEASRPGD